MNKRWPIFGISGLLWTCIRKNWQQQANKDYPIDRVSTGVRQNNNWSFQITTMVHGVLFSTFLRRVTFPCWIHWKTCSVHKQSAKHLTLNWGQSRKWQPWNCMQASDNGPIPSKGSGLKSKWRSYKIFLNHNVVFPQQTRTVDWQI